MRGITSLGHYIRTTTFLEPTAYKRGVLLHSSTCLKCQPKGLWDQNIASLIPIWSSSSHQLKLTTQSLSIGLGTMEGNIGLITGRHFEEMVDLKEGYP